VADQAALSPGDSGAWVVDYNGGLYGHVIASDVFGSSYVVPMADIFQDIKLRLSLENIKLPAHAVKVPPDSGYSSRRNTPREPGMRREE